MVSLRCIRLIAPLFVLCASVAVAATNSWPWWSRNGLTRNPPDIICAVKIPPGFTAITPTAKTTGRLKLNARFRSPEGSVEFAVAVGDEGTLGYQVANGERVLSVKPSTYKGKGPHGESYTSRSEEITIQGPKGSYTRYLKNDDGEILWEFKVASETARKKYQSTYIQFKNGLSLPGMGD